MPTNYPPTGPYGVVGGPLPHLSPNSSYARTLTSFPTPLGGAVTSPWTLSTGVPSQPKLVGNLTTNAQLIDCADAIHDLATLLSVTCNFTAQTHASLPAVQPSMFVERFNVSTGISSNLSSSAQQFAAIATVGAYNNGGNAVSFTYTCNQNNVIDKGIYRYMIVLVDESGANSIAGNLYWGFQLTYRMNAMLGDFTALWWP
jgi:hypothetical protein